MAVIDQVPDADDWLFVRGDTVTFPFQIGTQYDDGSFEAWDLTGWTIQGQVRSSADSDTVLTTIVASIHEIQNGETKGVYSLSLDDSSELPPKAVGDVEFIDPDDAKSTLQRFNFKVTKDVSRIVAP